MSEGMSAGSAGVSSSAGAGASTSTGASSAGQSQSAAPSAGAQRQSASPGQGSTSQSVNPNASGKAQAQAPNPQGQQAQTQAVDDGFEEIALGSTKAKVPKDIAKTIKEYERGLQRKMEEQAQIRKAYQEQQRLLQVFEKDPVEFFKAQGKDFDSIAEEMLARKYELMQMDPVQRENLELKQRFEAMQRAEMESKQGILQELKEIIGDELPQGAERASKEELQAYLQHQKQVYQQTQEQLGKELVEAWKESGLPNDRFFGAQMAFLMRAHRNSTGEDLTPKDAAAKIKEQYVSNVRKVIGALDAKSIIELIGPENAERLRKHDIEQVTANPALSVQSKGPAESASQRSTEKKYLNQFEWRKAMGLA